ncbi:MAG: hypothetical protein M1820_001991 [Bogoriella megaspora]|nr:MAG: hypothetical protein M1820_001991 [Bogoriella megaspora]
MAGKQSVVLLGATGQTGKSILDGLVELGGFDIKLLVRKASLEKPEVQALKKQGFEILIGDPAEGADTLVPLFKGIDTVLSAIDARSVSLEIPLVEASKKAGVKRFVPCAYMTVVPPGVMELRDEKQKVYQAIWKAHLPYTVIDVGFWHQISFPPLPSGRVDYAVVLPSSTITGDGKAPNLLTDLRDIGRYVARIIKDDRTLNKFVITWSDELSQNEIFALLEELSGENIERKYETAEELLAATEAAIKAYKADANNVAARFGAIGGQYKYSKYIREDNTLDVGKYLGYLDAKELYPEFKPIAFKEYVVELLNGKSLVPYPKMKKGNISEHN